MKQLFIAIILLLAVGETHAQKWFTPASKWYYNVLDMSGTNSAFEITKQKDTIIDGKSCVKFASREKSPYTQQWAIADYGDYILYDDTMQKIQYIVVKGQFYVLFDFNKSIGDTIFTPAIGQPKNMSNLDSGAWSRIDSMGIDTIMGNPYRTMFYTELRKTNINNPYDWIFEGKIIEGIGNTYTPWPRFQLIQDLTNPSFLRCFENETINLKLFDLPCDTSINYVSVKEIFDDKSVTIFPNPFNENLSVDLSKLPQTEVSIIFLNNIGQTILTQSAWTNHIINISTSNFNAGIYLCKIKVLDRVLTYKIIKP